MRKYDERFYKVINRREITFFISMSFKLNLTFNFRLFIVERSMDGKFDFIYGIYRWGRNYRISFFIRDILSLKINNYFIYIAIDRDVMRKSKHDLVVIRYD